jgi:hypothetical protein
VPKKNNMASPGPPAELIFRNTVLTIEISGIFQRYNPPPILPLILSNKTPDILREAEEPTYTTPPRQIRSFNQIFSTDNK